MIVSNRNNFFRITIVLIIITFSKELSIQRTPGVRGDIYQRKRNADSELGPIEPDEHYHRNDIGHLNDYYQERMKLREQYNAIQKAIQERAFQNNTTLSDVPRRSHVNVRPVENRSNVNSFDTFQSLKPGIQNINQASPVVEVEPNATQPNLNSNSETNTAQTVFQNKTHVQLGSCEGFVVYRQNIVITGANYDVINGYSVDVNLEGICITCIEIMSKNGEEVKVKITSGGPGKGNTSIRFEGFNTNINLSYVLKVWGKTGDC